MRTLKYLIIVSVLLTGCASKMMYLQEDNFISNKYTLDLTIKSISIIDQREGITNRELKIPFLSWPGQKDDIVPVLSDDHEILIKSEINGCIKNEGPDVDVIIYIEDSKKEFRANFFSEVEYVYFKCKINVYDGIHQPYLISTSGESWYQVETLDASRNFIEKLYQKAIKAAINECIKSISDFIKSNNYDQKPIESNLSI